MPTLSRRAVIATALVGTVAVAVPTTLAATGASQAQPANKAVAAGSHMAVAGPGEQVRLLTATFKTSKPEDLLMTASLECSILTALTTNSENPSAEAKSAVRVWIEVDGKIVPVEDLSSPPQDPTESGNGTEADKITFCNREYQRTVTDQEDPADGIDQESDYIRTKSSHAFSWVRLNAGAGDHTAVLFAEFTNATSGMNAQAEAIVGNRTLVIEPTKLANNAVIAESGSG